MYVRVTLTVRVLDTYEYQETLIGKRIRHRWRNEDGTEQWYNGKILSAVAGSTEWFNVAYDGESDVLTLNLYEDIENGDLDIVLVFHSNLCPFVDCH